MGTTPSYSRSYAPAPVQSTPSKKEKKHFSLGQERQLAAESRGISLSDPITFNLLGRSKVATKTLLGG